ncbi:MAG: VWA domain-containing protein [Acidimicrobiales bacterium]
MRRAWGALATVLVLLALVGVAPASAQDETTGAPDTPDGGPAIDDLVGCVQSSQRLLVLFLIDESASLKASDPEDRRVEAAQGALDSLLSLATAEGAASPSVDLAFAAFSNEYRLVQDWTPAGEDTAAELTDALAGFADLESGIDTDFVNALSSGRDALADRSAEVTRAGGAAPCRAVLLFTDGGFDLAVRESAADRDRLGTTKPYAPGIELTSPEAVQEAEAAGRRALCEPDGLADQLRADDVTLLTVALSGGVARRAQLPLAAATAGTADDYTCGTPTEEPTGAYLPAAGVDVLVARFNEIGVRLAGGNPYPGAEDVAVCGDSPCAEGQRTFSLDQGLRRAQVVALAPEPGAVLRLEGPSGASVDLTEGGTASVGEVAVTARSLAGRGLTVDLERPEASGDWDGTWTASLLDPSGDQEGEDAILQVFVFSDLGVAFVDLPALVRGAGGDLRRADGARGPRRRRARDGVDGGAAGHRPDPGDDHDGGHGRPACRAVRATVPVPAELTSNGVQVEVVAQLTTSSGAQLVARSAPAEVLVERPPGSIQILPASLKMPSLTGTGATETTIILQGAEEDGRLVRRRHPCPRHRTVRRRSRSRSTASRCRARPTASRCPRLATTITIAASPDGRASGAVQGSVQVFERAGPRPRPPPPTCSSGSTSPAGWTRLGGCCWLRCSCWAAWPSPMLLLVVINALTARFQTLDVVRGAAVPVRVGPRGAVRTDGPHERSLALREGDFRSLAGLGTARRFTFGGVVFRAKASRNLPGATVAMAAPEGGAEKLKGNAGSRVELDPGLAGSWVFLVDAGAGAARWRARLRPADRARRRGRRRAPAEEPPARPPGSPPGGRRRSRPARAVDARQGAQGHEGR